MAKEFIPVFVLAPNLAIPTFASAPGNGLLVHEPMRAELNQPQQVGHDHTTGATQYSATILANLRSVAAQQQAFASYGGAKPLSQAARQ